MKTVRNILFVLLILVMAISMVGCQKATEEPAAPVETEKPAVPTETEAVVEEPAEIGVEGCRIPAPDKPTTVNVIGWSYPIIDFYFEELKKCNGVENLTVNTQLMDSGSAGDAIRLAAATGGTSTYDIILNSGGNVQELADMDATVPLDDFIKKYNEKYNIDDIVGWENHKYKDITHAIPIENNTELFFYRADLFEKYNLEAPVTWDDVIEACKVLQAEDSIDIPGTLTLYAGWAWDLEFNQMLVAQGISYVNDDTFMPQFNGPEGVAAVEKIIEVAEACNGEEGMTYSIDDSEIAMETGGQALSFTWASRGANMDNPEKSNFVGMINFSPAPKWAEDGPYAAFGGGASLSIMSGSAVDKDLLFQMIMEVTDFDSQVEAAKLGIASRLSVAEIATARYYKASMETIADGLPTSDNPANGLASIALSNWLPLAMTGDYTIQELLDNAAAEYIEQATTAGYIK